MKSNDQKVAVIYYGFSCFVSFESEKGGGTFTMEFPKGYNPNGSYVVQVADKLKKQFDAEVIELADNIIKIRVGEKAIANVFIHYHMNCL